MLKNVKLAYRDAQSGAKNDLLLRQLSVKQAKGDTLAVTLAADVDGNEIAAEGTLGSLAELMGPSRPWPVKLAVTVPGATVNVRSEEHTSELQALMRNSYAVFCLN